MAYNLQGIIRKATTNMSVEFDKLAYITQNFANVNTNGYKSVRFEEIIDADGSVHGVERVDMKTGDYLITNNPLDIALQGAGYIPVTTPNGEIRYTRDGSFMKNKDGFLVTKTGDLVGSGIKIDGTCEKIEIRTNGDIYTYKRVFDEPEYVGTIPVVQFENPEALKDVGANEFVATENSGKMKLVEDHNYIKQYGIERANVDVISDIYTVSRINASILASNSLMKAINTMYDEAINLTQ
ncbi:MAG: flagellar hook-basal body complex protein [Candidatus Gastranaerophilales bacterium]|nr:flagellar hook-basal body complex protein [Candidatus Gastranaerophilales bacterium]